MDTFKSAGSGAEGGTGTLEPEQHVKKPKPGFGGGKVPPLDFGDDGGGGGGDGDGDNFDDDARKEGIPLQTMRLGVWLFLGAIGSLFFAFFAGYWALRADASQWPPAPDSPIMGSLLRGLWIGTGLIALLSYFLWRATKARRKGRLDRCKRLLMLCLLLATSFLANQFLLLYQYQFQNPVTDDPSYSIVLVSLVSLHGLHVFGGWAFLLFVIFRVKRGNYFLSTQTPVEFVGLYWYFITLLWLVIFWFLR